MSASANVDAATAANEMGYLFTDGSEGALLSATSALGMSYIWFENQPRVRDKIFLYTLLSAWQATLDAQG